MIMAEQQDSDGLVAELLEYARGASKELTHHAGGGSEMFLKIGDQHYADPKLCRERIWHRNETAQRLHDATIEAMSRQLVEMRETVATALGWVEDGHPRRAHAMLRKALEGSAP